MVFTPEQEQQIIEENMVKIYRAVDNFTARCTSDVARVPYDEFVQEVSLAFLLYIRKCETQEEIDRFPWYTAMDAMRNAVLMFQPMSCPKSSHRFREIIHGMPSTVSADTISPSVFEVNGMAKHWVDDKDTLLDFERFMDSYDENTKRLVSMRYGGMTLKEVAAQYGVHKTTVLRRIRNLEDDYLKFLEEEDENE